MITALCAPVLGFVPWNKGDTYKTFSVAGGNLGKQDGPGGNASFSLPVALALDTLSQRLFVADQGNHLIRSIDLRTSIVSTFAGSRRGYHDGAGRLAKFSEPSGALYMSLDIRCTGLDGACD